MSKKRQCAYCYKKSNSHRGFTVEGPLFFAAVGTCLVVLGIFFGVWLAPHVILGTQANRDKVVHVWKTAEKYDFKDKDINLITDLFLVENGCMGSTTTVFYFNMDRQTDYYCGEITGTGDYNMWIDLRQARK